MTYPFSTSLSLQRLDGEDWGEPAFLSHLVTTVHRLRRVPLDEYTVEDLRIMLGQTISPEYLVPVALSHLSLDPFVQGDFYPGDLLKNVIELPPAFWSNHPDLLARVREIVIHAHAMLRNGPPEDLKFVATDFQRIFPRFLASTA